MTPLCRTTAWAEPRTWPAGTRVTSTPSRDLDTSRLEQELAEHATGGLAYYKVPTHWRFTDSALPRNATGKVVRAAVTP